MADPDNLWHPFTDRQHLQRHIDTLRTEKTTMKLMLECDLMDFYILCGFLRVKYGIPQAKQPDRGYVLLTLMSWSCNLTRMRCLWLHWEGFIDG
ncbi:MULTISPECIES: hypothetical protein [unclassified Citrobacter]|uniref:hypothetical protein n=1 Tax=unclassified Citrobacter TaxID=2644389 RepID=UPI0021685ACF|nr:MULTISPECIES: hypothetical protein [unclassified Citrobacter]MCS3463158.1 hypothetical protein [Citrobacter sp. JUb117]MDW2642329.1 hypothetical protein [Citrobacter sp. HN-141]MDW2651676.1 hypothetical protein [Citrobacter sp. HN-120]MDW2694701.1 hypothetical protein [Citrobacter sp. HN-144]